MTKRKLRFTFVDVLILALLAAAATLLFLVFGGKSEADSTELPKNTMAKIEYVIEIKEVDANILRALTPGQEVEDAVTRRKIGVLKAYSESPTEKPGFDFENNEEVYSEADGLINLTLTVTADAVESDAAFTVDNFEIRVGKQISVILPEFQGAGYCISLTKFS